MKKVDVLWLVEHVAREMDVACAVKAVAESRYGLEIAIRNIYHNAKENMQSFDPAIVAHPFFYYLRGALATEDYVRTWPDAVHFNLAWEEIHYKAHQTIKSPSDEFVRKQVIHHAWGNFYKTYLLQYGVPEKNIFVNGQPAYQLYLPPYRQHFHGRDWLAKKHGLEQSHRWIFIPENYRWAFIDSKVNLFTRLGGDPEEMNHLKEFSRSSLKILLKWCNQIAEEENLTVIFRPRPATNSNLIAEFIRENIGALNPGLQIIKDGSVREWILASDIVISSYSTSLIEAAIAGKPAFMIEPISLPDSLYYEWYAYTPRLHNLEEFKMACSDNLNEEATTLREWACREMLSNGDPIEQLAKYLVNLVEQSSVAVRQVRSGSYIADRFWGLKKKEKKYFNPATHEKDVFADQDVQASVEAWKKTLKLV